MLADNTGNAIIIVEIASNPIIERTSLYIC
jgi:hypothetical protein